MRAPRRIVALVIAATVGMASAQPSTAERERALELFRDSDAHYKRGEFESAATLLREAYELHPEPILLYNLARALEGLGDFTGAIEQYERYLNVATEIADRGAIERRIATLRAQVERTVNPPSTTGDHTPAAVSDTRTSPATVPASPRDDRLDGPDMHPRSQRLPWLIAGGGGVVLGGGVLLGYLSQARHDAAVDEPIQAEAARLQGQARDLATAANVALVVGGAAVIGGVTWALLARRDDRSPPRVAGARLGLAPASITATWTFE